MKFYKIKVAFFHSGRHYGVDLKERLVISVGTRDYFIIGKLCFLSLVGVKML